MDLKQVELFLELAKELHFWRTAEKVFITQSALSRQIQAMEKDLGFALFVRNKRNVNLTPAGEFMRNEWSVLLDRINNVHWQAREISIGELGTVRIGHPGSISFSYLPDLIDRAATQHPGIKFELIEASSMEIDPWLLEYKVDLALSRDAPRSEQLDSKFIAQDSLGLFVPRDHWITEADKNQLKKLSRDFFILPALSEGSVYANEVRNIFNELGFQPRTRIESDFGTTILSLVARGLGVSLMPLSYELQMPKGVRCLPLQNKTNLYAIWRKRDSNPAIMNVLDVV